MLPLNAEEEIKQLDKKIVKLQIVAAPFNIALGLGLYGTFVDEPGRLFGLMGNPTFVNVLVGVGAAGLLWEFLQVFGLVKRKTQLTALNN
jgi:hypothetical protein